LKILSPEFLKVKRYTYIFNLKIPYRASKNISKTFQVLLELLPFQKGNIFGWISAVGRAGPRFQQRVQAGIIFFFCGISGKNETTGSSNKRNTQSCRWQSRSKTQSHQFPQSVPLLCRLQP
jgi:hypothetical protein